jgi:hypothetical protein
MAEHARHDVMVVPAKHAYPLYLAESVYWLPHPRFTRQSDLRWVAFYADGAIQPHIAHILDWAILGIDDLPASLPRLRTDLERVAADASVMVGRSIQLIRLSAVGDPRTVVLKSEIRTKRVDRRGRRIAWAMRARYVQLDALKKMPKTTEALEALSSRPIPWNRWEEANTRDTATQ